MFEKVFRYISSLETVDKFLNFNFFNLEEVFGIIDLADMIGENGTDDKTLGNPYLECFRILIKTVIEVKQKKIDWDQNGDTYRVYRNFLHKSFGAEHKKRALITFNYDEIIEKAYSAWTAHLAGSSKDELFPMHDHFKVKEGGMPFLKLHGSVGWSGGTSDPYILPPTWNKTLKDDVKDVFTPIWIEAHEVLVRAEQIVFIGYSFPDTDQYFRHFLAFALSKNEDLRQILVVNPDEKVDERFRAILGPHFLKYYRYFPVMMEDAYSDATVVGPSYWASVEEYRKLVGIK